MAFESFKRINTIDLNPEKDLIEIYNQKTGMTGVVNPNQLSTPLPGGSLKVSLPLSSTLQVVKDGSETPSSLLLSTNVVTNYGAGNIASNTAFGGDALISNTTGTANTAIGDATLTQNTTGRRSVAIGRDALKNNTASANTAVGFQAGLSNITGDKNVLIGTLSDVSSSGVLETTAIGYSAKAGNRSAAVGIYSVGGVNGVAIGYAATNNFTGSVVLGFEAAATGSNQFVVGTATTNAGAVTSEVNASSKVWNVIINGVAQKILLA